MVHINYVNMIDMHHVLYFDFVQQPPNKFNYSKP